MRLSICLVYCNIRAQAPSKGPALVCSHTRGGQGEDLQAHQSAAFIFLQRLWTSVDGCRCSSATRAAYSCILRAVTHNSVK